MTARGIAFRVVCGDVLGYPTDVLALKHAQELYGVDELVVALLRANGHDVRNRLPGAGESLIVPGAGTAASHVLFVGVPELWKFDYGTVRQFSRDVLATLGRDMPQTRHVAVTLHGRGVGLDEAETFKAEIGGLLDAIRSGNSPAALESVSIVELDDRTAARLTKLLATILPAGQLVDFVPVTPRINIAAAAHEALESAGESSKAKPHVFVAMPFAPELDDRFHYGIKGAVNAAGYLCERADLASFTGDVMAWVRERIDKAELILADLSTANPNVYLEVRYAWGRAVPTVSFKHLGSAIRRTRTTLPRLPEHPRARAAPHERTPRFAKGSGSCWWITIRE